MTELRADRIEDVPVRIVCMDTKAEHCRHVKMPTAKEFSRADVIARAKALGLRDYKDRVVLAIQNDEIPTTLVNQYSRDVVDEWIEDELRIDSLEDESTMSLAQARALAREGGLEDYSMAVLNAVTRQEIEGVYYHNRQPHIPIAAFKVWLEDQGPTEADWAEVEADEVVVYDPELAAALAQFEDYKPGSGVVFVEAVKMYWWPALAIIGAVRLFAFLLSVV